MDDPRSLPGFLKKSFALPYHGGEIWFEHLDGMHGQEALVLEKLAADSASFLRPSAPGFLCVNVDETLVTERILDAICASLTTSRKVFRRVCFVGAGRRTAALLAARLGACGFALGFISDFEKTKEWLLPSVGKDGSCETFSRI